MDLIHKFLKVFKETKYENLSSKAVEAAKKEVLDSLATALGGSSATGIKELVNIIKEWGGSKQSTIIAYGIKCPTPNAAQVNGSMIHALDYDDGHPNALVHTGCTTVSTSFAVAELVGKASGKKVITAISLGVDFMTRLSLASRPGANLFEVGWHPTMLYGFLGSACIAGIIMGLDEKQMLNALGIAYHQASGNMQCIHDGALSKRFGPGLAAKGGISAAIMAQRGLTGANNILEGKAGLFKLYHNNEYDPQKLLSDLGTKFEIENIGFKPYPSCGHTHAFIDAVISLRSKYKIDPNDIEEIKAFGGDAAYGLCVPREIKQNPRNVVDAQFSIPWNVATAIVKGKVTLEDFTEKAIKNKDILKISNKVVGIHDPSLTRHGVGPGKLTIYMKDGKSYTEEVEFCLGSAENPMSLDDCAKKFRECATYSIRPITKSQQEKAIDLIMDLEKLDDVSKIITLLS